MKYLFILILLFSTSVWSQVESVPVVGIDKNWSSSISYDFSGATISKGVSYFDALGKGQQSQSWDVLTGRVWASEVRYDSFGRSALPTLSAPVNSTGSFVYRADFIRSMPNSATYVLGDFDGVSTTDGPRGVSNMTNTLGWYYSSANTIDGYQDVTDFPFTRMIYSDLNPGTSRALIGGNRVNVNGVQQWLQSYSFSMAMEKISGASTHPFYKNFSGKQMLKTVSRGVDGIEAVVFTDSDGNLIGSARSGIKDDGTQVQYNVYSEILDKGYVDVHIPQGNSTPVNVTLQIPSGSTIVIYDLITEQLLSGSYTANQTLSLASGFYRFEDKNRLYGNGQSSQIAVKISYTVNYYDLAYNEYDLANRLVRSTQPLNSLSGVSRIQSSILYNSLGQVLESNSPDEGLSRFQYREDGQIRFSQNSEQAKVSTYSYTNYDNLARPIESGVYRSNLAGSISFENADAIVNLPDGLTPQGKSNQTYSVYDIPDTELAGKLALCALPNTEYRQTFLSGNVSYGYTNGLDFSKTWYSYDVYGRVVFIIQDIQGLGCVKTIDYEYDPVNG